MRTADGASQRTGHTRLAFAEDDAKMVRRRGATIRR